jgi:3-keto steroid reductase
LSVDASPFFQTGWLTLFKCGLLGAPWFPITATAGVVSIIYASLIPERYLQPADKVPAQRFHTVAHRLKLATVKYGEVDYWEDTLDIGEALAKACETIRLEWRRKEALE